MRIVPISQLLLPNVISTVFRELLQNSDDASSKSVEIRFETQAYIDRRKEAPETTDNGASQAADKLPDLKTELVSHVRST